MLRSWWAWAVTTFFMALYVAVARVESTSVRAPLELRPGNEIELTVFRAFAEQISAGISYRNAACVQLPDGAFSPFWNTYKEVPGYFVYTPAPMIRLEIGNGDRKPVLYEALPDRICGSTFRRLTPNLSIAPGVYPLPWPASVSWISLERSRNKLRIKVAEVDAQMLGRTVEVSVLAPLGFKTARSDLFFFWFAFFLEPVFWVTQSIWLLSLLARWWWSIKEKAD
jgi:hypothetical protein